MEFTYENILRWFEGYFEDVRKSQGALETVPNLKKYFAPDLELMMYTAPSSPPAKLMSRDALLLSFVHPGLQEDIVPNYYVIDLKQMIVAIQFEIRFSDKPSGKRMAVPSGKRPLSLAADEDRNLKIKKIHYWTETLPGDLFDFWANHRDAALAAHAISFINAKP